jgi:hypothetical protein
MQFNRLHPVTVRHFIFLFLLACSWLDMYAQHRMHISGVVIDGKSSEPLAYASVYNQSTGKGTLTNLEGAFTVDISAISDTIRISYIGYKTYLRLDLQDMQQHYVIRLDESSQLLSEVVIRPKDNSYLYDLITRCKKNATFPKTEAKAYYELKSFRDEHQVELVEAFYNAQLQGYELNELDMKAGRLALQPYNDRLFGSMESSRAITELTFFKSNPYFPSTPIELSSKELRKKYYLHLDKKYLNENKDSIYVLSFESKSNPQRMFTGNVWINKTKESFVKITLQCDTTSLHPFVPLFPTDSIESVSFDITKTFEERNGQVFFNHIDFIYSVNYKSRIGELHEQRYSVTTKAVLHLYDFDKLFFIPFVDETHDLSDYRKMNAMPYNEFFWSRNDEFRLNGSRDANEDFFTDTISETNRNIFNQSSLLGKKLFQAPYVQWSKDKRILLNEIPQNTKQLNVSATTLQERYELDVEIFLDVNRYDDSTNVTMAAIFDPYDTFYNLPIDNQTLCFINMYFDLCEIERRKLQSILSNETLSDDEIRQVYQTFMKDLKQKQYSYIKLMNRGTNEKEMKRLNADVMKQLGIDNIVLFQPFH